jgi:type IX secretion system PorP/SprF family membrane protein
MNIMKTTRSIFIVLTVMMLVSLRSLAQDVHFSQFFMAPINQNPGLAGALFDDEAILNYKEQWRSMGAPFKTIGATFDTRINKKHMASGIWGGGINFFSDKAGDSQMGTTMGTIALAYHKYLDSYNTIGVGISGGFAQRSIRYDALQWGNQYDGSAYNPALGSGESGGLSTFGYGEFGAGVVWAYNNPTGYKQVTDNHDSKFNAGFSVFHGQQSKYSFYNDASEKLSMKYVLHGNGIWSIKNSNLAWVPGFMAYMQGQAIEVTGGIMARYKLKQDSKFTGFQKGSAFSIGGFIRAKDAVIATAMMEFSHFSLGFSYDINISGLTPATNSRGGLELSLRYVTPNPFTKRSSKAMF